MPLSRILSSLMEAFWLLIVSETTSVVLLKSEYFSLITASFIQSCTYCRMCTLTSVFWIYIIMFLMIEIQKYTAYSTFVLEGIFHSIFLFLPLTVQLSERLIFNIICSTNWAWFSTFIGGIYVKKFCWTTSFHLHNSLIIIFSNDMHLLLVIIMQLSWLLGISPKCSSLFDGMKTTVQYSPFEKISK